jgi:hypothetical protein
LNLSSEETWFFKVCFSNFNFYRYVAALNGFIQQANTRRVWWGCARKKTS